MFLSIDIGGSYTRIALSKDGKSIDKKVKYETPKKYDDGIDLLVEQIEELTGGKIPKALTLAAASPIDYEKGVMTKAPNLPSYKGHSIRKELELRLRAKVYLENDAAIGALGEASKRPRSKILGFVNLEPALTKLPPITKTSGVQRAMVFASPCETVSACSSQIRSSSQNSGFTP